MPAKAKPPVEREFFFFNSPMAKALDRACELEAKREATKAKREHEAKKASKTAKFPKAAAKRRAKRASNKRKGKDDRHEVELLRQLSNKLMAAPVREFGFCEGRRWKFDLAWPRIKLAVEIEGGIFIGGRHVNPLGFMADCEKYNAALELGWVVLRFVPDWVKDGTAAKQVMTVYQQRVALLNVMELGEEVAFGERAGLREQVRAIILERREREQLAGLLLEGTASGTSGVGEAGAHGTGLPNGAPRANKKRARKKDGD